MDKPEISFAIPCYNESDNVAPLLDAVEEAATNLGKSFEVVITDDCSTDGSWETLKSLLVEHPRLRIQRLARNSGQSAAVFSAMRSARGDVIVTLDADLQNDPRDLPKFFEALANADCVCGSRTASRRHSDHWVKHLTSRAANWVRARVLHDRFTDAGCAFRAFRRECIENIPFFKGVHRFLPILIDLRGYRVTEVPVTNRPRYRGESHYGIFDRSGAVIDMLAVRWMKTRMVNYEVAERYPSE